MLPKKIPFLEKFGLCFLTMSFFGSTHRSFLLLSKLSKQSRAMLSKNYEGFLNCMIKNNACLLINNGDEAKLNLPCDLFNYNISLDSGGKLNAFIQTIGNILNKSGYYFNEKFMHSRMCVERILLHSDFVSKLYPCVESLKKVEAVECIRNRI